jgi:hypothetical protein
MERLDELQQMERARWDEFRRLVDGLTDAQIEEATLNRDGWSVKDLLWHMRCWNDEIAGQLERIRVGSYVDEDYDTDEKNARFFDDGRRKDLTTVRADWLASRDRAVEQLGMQKDVTPPVEEWGSELAFKHMDDHLLELRRLAPERGSA